MKTAARFFSLVLILMTVVVSAQPLDYSTGGNLKRRQYQTYAAMTLYVDPTGSDSNACTASGTAACLTLGAALLKVPIHIRHLVTANVAAGTYTEVFRVQDFFIEGAPGAASTAALTITGVESAFTTATGTNTGTFTSDGGVFYTAGGTAGAHTLVTDNSQSWTVNDLRGRFFQITGGTGSGQYRPIVSNTATTISLSSNFTTPPAAASTYGIVTPGPIFTGATPTVRGITGGGAITISDVSFQPTGSAFTVVQMTNSLTTTRVRFAGTTSGTSSSTVASGPFLWSLNQNYIAVGTSSGLTVARGSTVSASDLLVRCTVATCSGSAVTNQSAASRITLLTGTLVGDFTNGLLTLQSSPNIQSNGLWFDCGAGTNTAILLPTATDTAARFAGSSFVANTGPYMNGCGTGYSLNNPSFTWIDGTIFTSVTTAISLTAGARVVIEASPTFTGVTNQLSIDGTVYTDADLTTFTRITGPQGSYATRP